MMIIAFVLIKIYQQMQLNTTNNQFLDFFQFYSNIIFDFHKLACLQPDLRPFLLILNNRTVCNFKKQDSLIILNKAILKHCFNLLWDCPSANLCPRIPSRLNYLIWIHLQIKDIQIKTILDVGTGATVIYPLLGIRCFGWKFVASEINKESFLHSKQLIKMNNLQQSIDLRLIHPQINLSKEQLIHKDDFVLKNTIKESDQIDVVICNPPFFEQERQTLTNMVQSQHHIEGGEYSFFFALYRESCGLSNIKYISCLIGLLKNYLKIKELLLAQKKQGFLSVVKFGQIQQGNNLRYLVLWRFKH